MAKFRQNRHSRRIRRIRQNSPLCRYPYLELNRSLAKYRQNRHSRRIRRIRQNSRFVGTPISSSIALWRNIAILAEFAGFAKIAASSVPLSRAESLFGKILPKSPFSPNSPKSQLRRYPYLELNHSLANFRQNRHSRRIRRIRQNRRFVGTPISSSITLWRNIAKIAILAKFAGFAKIAASSVPLSRAESLFGKILPKSPFSPNSPKSQLRRYPYLELNHSLAKFRQNRHSRRIRRIRQNRSFVGTPISSSITLWRNIAKIAILAKFAGFAKIAASSVPLSRAESLFRKILPKSPFSPNSPKSQLRRYPYLELNHSLAKFRQNRHSRRIRQNRSFVGTPISSSITLWRNIAKIAILAKFAGFAKIAASSVPLSRAQSLFGKILPKSPKSPFSPNSPKSQLRRYPYLELNHSLAKFRQNRHSRRIRRIRQNRRFVGTPISSSITRWRNIAKIAILAKFAGFAASSVPLSRAQSLFGKILPKSPFSPNSPDSPKLPLRRYPYLELNHSLAKYRQNCHSRQIRRNRQNRRFVGTPISSSITLWQNFAKIAILAEFTGFAKIAASSVPLS